MEYFLAVKNKGIMNFVGIWMELENIILGEITQTQNDVHSDKWILSQKYKIYMIEPTHLMLNKKECLSEDILLPSRWNKASMGGWQEGESFMGDRKGKAVRGRIRYGERDRESQRARIVNGNI